jgi:hypothetical protein
LTEAALTIVDPRFRCSIAAFADPEHGVDIGLVGLIKIRRRDVEDGRQNQPASRSG